MFQLWMGMYTISEGKGGALHKAPHEDATPTAGEAGSNSLHQSPP